MKKSEIINYLQSKKCKVISYAREFYQLNVFVKELSSSILVDLENKGLKIILTANGNKIIMEITGNIEWDWD